MFARITKYKMKPGTRDDAVKVLEGLKSQILGLPGTLQFINAANEDGLGYVVSVNQSREQSEQNAEAVTKIWANFADFMEAMPQPEGFDIVANWKN
ncbi:MAG: hypothetical protein LJE68_00880 [Rhodobacter sp.]|nr:hypothetical protein [Rhodobacter sp.]